MFHQELEVASLETQEEEEEVDREVETIREVEVGQVCQELLQEDLLEVLEALLHPPIQVPPVAEEDPEVLEDLLHHPTLDQLVELEVQAELEHLVSTK